MPESREHALALLQKARDDRYVLERLAEDPQAPLWTIGFHAQQAVEKALKAVLTDQGTEYPYTHNLSALVKLLEGAGVATPADAAVFPRLTPYGAPLRYEPPVGKQQESHLDPSWATGLVKRTLAWAEDLLV